MNKSLITGLLVAVVFVVTSCSLRQNVGEDMHTPNPTELEVFVNNLAYTKDTHGICYAVLNNHTQGHRSTFTFSTIPCDRVWL